MHKKVMDQKCNSLERLNIHEILLELKTIVVVVKVCEKYWMELLRSWCRFCKNSEEEEKDCESIECDNIDGCRKRRQDVWKAVMKGNDFN